MFMCRDHEWELECIYCRTFVRAGNRPWNRCYNPFCLWFEAIEKNRLLTCHESIKLLWVPLKASMLYWAQILSHIYRWLKQINCWFMVTWELQKKNNKHNNWGGWFNIYGILRITCDNTCRICHWTFDILQYKSTSFYIYRMIDSDSQRMCVYVAAVYNMVSPAPHLFS